MKLAFGGGASEVGASFLLLQLDGKNIALDCGVRMSGDPLPDFGITNDFGSLDCVLLSHAHMDHSGALPLLSRAYPNAKIYMTHATKDLIQILLYDSLKIMESRESEIPIYSLSHVEQMLDNVLCFSPTHTFKPFSNSDITVTFYSAGHIAGAVGIFVSGTEGSFFYSGDFSVSPQRTVEGASFPKLRPDVSVYESTYGDRLHTNREVEEERLVSKVSEVISRGGKLLIPAFSLGRSQEIILSINRAISKKQLPKSIKVYVDGMVNDVCRAFLKNPNYLRTQYGKRILKGRDIFYSDNVVSVNRNKELREKIVTGDDSCVIISSSGMLVGGPSQWYAERLANNSKNAIALTGYQDEESPGRQLMDLVNSDNVGDRVLKIGDKTIQIKCDVSMYGLSAHADKLQILALAESLSSKHTFFNHGNETVVESLGAEFQKGHNGRVYIPKNGETYNLEIHNKRKQVATNSDLDTMSLVKDSNDSEIIKKIWSFVLEHYGVDRPFTYEDLYYVCYGEKAKPFNLNGDSEAAFRDALNKEPYFEVERKRPFIYHAVAIESIDLPSGVMEVNAMLKLADEFFPKETGLYRKGARFEEKKVLLYFNFPITAINSLTREIEEFEETTGWKTEISMECNLGAAEQLIGSFFDDTTEFKISYYRNEKTFKATVDSVPDNTSEICRDFQKITGLTLDISVKGELQKPVQTDKAKGQMEQNQVFSLIDKTFSGTTHKVYKKSIKVRDNQAGIELSFITSNVGRLYEDKIKRLSEITYWPIWVNKETNQHELLKVTRDLLASHDIVPKKLSYIGEKTAVIISFLENELPIDIYSLEWQNICSEYMKLTGAELLCKV